MSRVDKIRQLFFAFAVMLLAFYVQELPSSNVLQKALPEWPYLLILYLSASSRHFFCIIFAFCIGAVQDVFIGTATIGLSAMIYVLAVYCLISLRQRFRYMSVFLQSLVVGVLVFFKVLIMMIYEAILYSPPTHFWVLLSVPLSMLVWPVVHLFFVYCFGNPTR